MENFFGHLSLSLFLKFQPPPPMIMIMMLMQIDLFHYGRHDDIIINSFIFLKISILGLMLWSKNFVVFKHVTSNWRLERRDHIWFYMIYERICEAHNLELRSVWHVVFDKKFFSRFIFPETQQSLPVPSTKVATPSRRRVSSSDSDPIPDSPPKGKIYSNIIWAPDGNYAIRGFFFKNCETHFECYMILWRQYFTYLVFCSYLDRVALLASSAGVDGSGSSAGGTSFPRAKGIWQSVIQKQKTVEDLVILLLRMLSKI